jgi:hypothetical protein
MSRAMFKTLLGCAIGLMIAGAAQAQPRIQPPGGGGAAPQPQTGGGNLIRGTNPELTASALKAAGYTDIEIIEVQGAKQVQAKVNGVVMRAWHYGCENNVCSSLQFFTTFGRQPQIDLNYINAWNLEKRFIKLYQDKQGVLSADMDIHFSGGTSLEFLRDSGAIFGHVLKVLFEFKPAQ